MTDTRYFLKPSVAPDDQWAEVTQEQFISAESAAGFHSKGGPGTVATGGFSSGGMIGKVVHGNPCAEVLSSPLGPGEFRPLVKGEVLTRSMTFESATDAFDPHRDYEVLGSIPEPYAAALAAMETDSSQCSHCHSTPVGYHLIEYDGVERGSWGWVSVATDGTKTWYLCEECSGPLEAPYVPEAAKS